MPDTAVAAPSVRQEASRDRRDPPWSRHRLVASLLDGSCPLADLRRAAVALGMPLVGSYRVVALHASGQARRAAGRAALGTAHGHVHWHGSRPVEHAIVLLGDPDRPDLVDEHQVAALPAGVRIGVSMPVEGLAALTDARRQAVSALHLCPPQGGYVDLSAHLPAAVLDADPALADRLRTQVLGPLATAGPDHTLLLDTFAAWVDSDGSTREAARRLDCHRNTVTNRLHRLERLTGRRVDRPADLVDLTLALAAHRRTRRQHDGQPR
ncbi:hypothetical protein GCM10009718_23440 [Isoptericola halotolerans]|uniref:PucR-like helix-turn-helix protein n=1 Tax=Isoptericola halotolerans TaxID=300560 RepID=A0ABX2A5J5_9MICO|nr:helix-turn-helix domain-containing protein [Isoptericola halotolerans]NOV98093.1 hypothetical protein [Isoptericola halotolerans]